MQQVPTKLSLYISKELNPYINLALENHFFMKLKEGEFVLFFYCNEPSVVMGRFQNPWVECDLGSMKRDGVKLVRRQSGGGCVYHDLGNLNYSLLSSLSLHNKEQNIDYLIESLATLRVRAHTSARHDIRVWDGELSKKISGSAFKQKRDRAFHHGTLLIESDLELLNQYLRSPSEITQTKSTASVRSQVINLKKINTQINANSLIDAIAHTFSKKFKLNCESYEVDRNDLEERSYLEQLVSTAWIYDETPLFTMELGNSASLLEFNVKKGIIQSLNFSSDWAHPGLGQELAINLKGEPFRNEIICRKISDLSVLYPMYRDQLTKLSKMVTEQLIL